MNRPVVRVLPVGEVAVPLPRYQTEGAAGLDLQAAIPAPLTLAVGERIKVPAGIAISLPEGFEAQVRPRSGLAARYGITVLNSPGTVDNDYRGELVVLLVNLGTEPFVLAPLARIAQLVVSPVARAELVWAESLPETARGPGGYGSTGA